MTLSGGIKGPSDLTTHKVKKEGGGTPQKKCTSCQPLTSEDSAERRGGEKT